MKQPSSTKTCSDSSVISILPIEASLDDRLSKIQLRVLIALFSFRNKTTDLIWPSREAIAERCGYSPRTITEATSDLVKLGWLLKVGNGGRSRSTRYRLRVPEIAPPTVPDSGPVSSPQRVPASGTVPEERTVPESGEKRFPNREGNGSRIGKGHRTDQEQSKEQTNTADAELDDDQPDPVDQVFAHWQAVMGHPKAALDSKRRKKIASALALGYSPQDLMDAIVGYTYSPHHMGRNDTGTRYDDIELIVRDAKHIDAGLKFFQNPPRAPPDRTSVSDRNKNVIQAFVARNQGASDFIEGQSQRVEDAHA